MPRGSQLASRGYGLKPNEFTGERVVPGKVDVDLWNEHFARYVFACEFADGKRVLDLGCGAGYGSAELARRASTVTGVDVAAEAIEHAQAHYSKENLVFQQASATATGQADASFDLIVAFEVIEHLANWRELLAEAKRLLAPGGLFLVSTPNRVYYAESRGESGANPYHVHEFEYEEFRNELRAFFPGVTMLMQNRVEAFSFQPPKGFPQSTARVDSSGAAGTAHFFLAICGDGINSRSFVYVPAAVNLLWEREVHIGKLQAELVLKGQWLEETRRERDELHRLYNGVQTELEEHNRWAQTLERELAESREHVVRLQAELDAEQASGKRIAEAYESKIAELERENREKTVWAEETEQRLTTDLQVKLDELAGAVRLLDQAEATVAERTQWAQQLDEQVRQLQAQMQMIHDSRWIKLGRLVGVGPRA
jgi:SAM-dependent methyltransferase